MFVVKQWMKLKIEEQEIQKLTDNYVKKIDEVYSLKEKDIMTI